MMEFEDGTARNKVYWVTHVLQRHTNLFACWCTTDEGGVPWLLGLFDEHFAGDLSIYDGRHSALLASPYITLSDLPATRTPFRDAGWPTGLCLSLEHYSGLCLYFRQYSDESADVGVNTKESLGCCPLDISVPSAVVGEYLACLSCDPTRWHERLGWIRNPRPFDYREWHREHLQKIEDLDVVLKSERRAQAHWFSTIQDELLHRLTSIL